jgi:hypothetical protein
MVMKTQKAVLFLTAFFLENDQWNRNESEYENDHGQDPQHLSFIVKRCDLIQWLSMHTSQQQEQEGPKPPSRPEKSQSN